MKLEEIGFYTLSDARAETASSSSVLMRGELLLGSRCNFSCPYCRHVGGEDISPDLAKEVVSGWIADGLRNVRFSGGRAYPLSYPRGTS
jgi:sulfatase maturation enzyme AslB (radical SAM superfamily)